MTSCVAQLARAVAVTAPLWDILERRVDDANVPGWCESRGWSEFLLGLDEPSLRQAEAGGLGAILPTLPGAPRTLLELAREVDSAASLPLLRYAQPLDQASLRNVKLRKRAQLAGLLGAVASMADHAERIVDVGAGSGHFTRLSAALFQRDALGLEQRVERVQAAERRAASDAGSATFRAVDAREGLELLPSDLAIGLHACGELGDRLVESAGKAACDVALVSCCLQKISGPIRRPLSQAASSTELRKEHLGLTNLTAQPVGVETSIEVTIAARQTRYALGSLLRARGQELEPGAEMSGINRRRAHGGLIEVAARALALRGLAPPSPAELLQHEALAARDYGRIRRLSLPRSMLARLVEVLVSLDRAAHLEESGHAVLVAALFERSISPRNIGIFASRSLSRLPAA